MFDDESDDLLVCIMFATVVITIIAFLIISFVHMFVNLYNSNIFYFITGVSAFVSLVAGNVYCEYNRIKTNDFNRIKEEIKKHIRSFYPEETFFIIDEKEVSKREILKRCFRTYELSIHVFAHHGELVYQVKVNKNEVWLKDFKQVSNVNFAKEFYKK
ncbi:MULTISPECIES: hypothetical protein [Bacillus]|uniref:Uncharacterized protein n=1 Tax=Bacillus cereus TaxID=1396 RepID=A0A9X6VVB3_BACCE|nr:MULTISPECIES: hypothetical protein [Bacillus cereus group]PEZ75327.1 hypothetical protein CN410_14750 [Bacillus anthracis]KXY51176.1 hypothetical protein AT268_32275 [Bacillus cereus]PES55116.1 hypothetical protein CN515_03370 [Bacillus cereus]PFA29514.1 hypothetical protein CN384_07385 [Bacillus thuringiensis]PFF46053.1 hypothetical protein CN357_21635 [Bacillus cereus]